MPLTIQEILRECTAEIHEAIRSCEGDIARAMRELEDARVRIESSSSSLSIQQSKIGAQQRRALQLETDLEGLRKQLEAKKSELVAARDDIQRVEGEASKLRRDKRAVQEQVENTDRQFIELQQNKERLAQRLGESHREALRRYVGELQKQIMQLSTEQHVRNAKLAAFNALKTARHENRQVADLLDARDEWRRMLKGAGVPAVIEAARRELDTIETKLDEAFPGALEAEEGIGSEEDIAELFFRHFEGINRTWLFIPMDVNLWNSLESDCVSSPNSWVMQFAWALRKNLDLKWEDTQFEMVPNHNVVILNTPLVPNIDKQNMVVALGASVSATFIFSPLPSVVEEAFDHDN
ncbi:MAG TPA: hypothetical protein DD417_03850 [Elusimicrobia bacterium]|nr:hypothetical protein [Elusimicrobiota bacterium]